MSTKNKKKTQTTHIYADTCDLHCTRWVQSRSRRTVVEQESIFNTIHSNNCAHRTRMGTDPTFKKQPFDEHTITNQYWAIVSFNGIVHYMVIQSKLSIGQ